MRFYLTDHKLKMIKMCTWQRVIRSLSKRSVLPHWNIFATHPEEKFTRWREIRILTGNLRETFGSEVRLDYITQTEKYIGSTKTLLLEKKQITLLLSFLLSPFKCLNVPIQNKARIRHSVLGCTSLRYFAKKVYQRILHAYAFRRVV